MGRNDVAYRLLRNDTFPSWGFSIKQGATSIWERWDGWTPEKGFQDPGMNSFAHYSFGAVYGWMAHTIGGRPDFELLLEPDSNVILYRYLPEACRMDILSGNLRAGQNRALNGVNEQVHKAQRQAGRTLVSRTTLFNTRYGRGVPVVAFSTDTQLAGDGTYLMGFLPRQEIERVVGFAHSRGASRFRPWPSRSSSRARGSRRSTSCRTRSKCTGSSALPPIAWW